MDKIPTDTPAGAASTSTTTTAEARTLRDVVYNKRSGGTYGSLAKSQTQSTYYISHKLESDDTLQRLALKYSINIQEIKRINKLWSDAELGLRGLIYIPVNATQLATLRNLYPDLEIVQSLPSSTNHSEKTSATTTTDNQNAVTISSSDSSTSIQPTTNNSSYHDYLSKIDQQIRSTKNSLQSLDIKDTFTNPASNNDDSNSPKNTRSSVDNSERHKGAHRLSDNSVFVNIPTSNNSRDKHVSAALKRIQQEKDDFDEL